jgi:metallo-beta-lactamase class B
MVGVSLLFTSVLAGGGVGATKDCPKCAEWTQPQKPFKVYGNTYYVGTKAISSLLVTSDKGHILIDGTVDESAEQVASNIKALGFKVEDVKVILNSHAHFDHAGGIAQLQKWSGAEVKASEWAAKVLKTGRDAPDDPLYGDIRNVKPVNNVRVLKDGEVVTVGSLHLTAHLTPGHTPGGTTWTWQSCEQSLCLNMVYADSLSAVSAASYKFSKTPGATAYFEHSFAVIDALPCDILITPHPEFVGLLDKVDSPRQFIDASACKRFVKESKTAWQKRLAREAKEGG